MSQARATEPMSPIARVRLLLSHPMSTYYLLAGSALLLLLLGLIMVLSASSIESYRIFGSSYTIAQRQLMYGVIGVVGMLVASRMPIRWFRWVATLLLLGIVGLLVVVLVIGVEVAGQRNWIEIFGPFRIQPSEFAKFALVLWGADVLTRQEHEFGDLKRMLMPVVPVTAAMMLLILAENDFGNALMLVAIACGMLFAAGAPGRVFAAIAGVGLVGVWILTLAAPYRMSRFTDWLDPQADRLGGGWQLTQGQYALGTGGIFGVGLGASREKWGSLPEAHTDFIFSVIGEELGLVGTLSVLVLFGVLAFAIFRLARTSEDTFVRLVSAGVGSWIVFQAVINIGAVLGLLPITGVPLPLVSYGGSSLVPTLVAVGVLMGFARTEASAQRPRPERMR